MKSSQQTLFGVKGSRERCDNGLFDAKTWARLRTPDEAWGVVGGAESVIWFADSGIRDEFRALFGGVNVTLQRKFEVSTGGLEKLADFRKAANA